MAIAPQRHLLPWNRPLLPQAVDWLAVGWRGDGPLDLSAQLVVVPTRQAGRRLREALAAHTAARGQAVFPPRVVQPETLATLGVPPGGVATRSEALLAWAGVLRGLRLEDFREVFPVDPPARDFAWARRLAGQLLKVQATLAEAALRIGEVEARAGADFPEAARWAQLAALERRYDAAMAARGLRDPQAAKISGAAAPVLPPGVEKIAVLATPDPLPLAVLMLERLAARVPVAVISYGPDESRFDGWGRPLAEAWTRSAPDWPDWRERIQLCADPAAQAARVVALAQSYPAPEGALAVGLGDPEVLASLEGGLARAGLAAFNPAGVARRRDGLHALLAAIADLAREDSFAHAAGLLRCPDVLAWLAARAAAGSGFSAAQLLKELDALHARHLPPTLPAALGQARARPEKFAAAAFALGALAELRTTLGRGGLADGAAAALAEIFAGRRVADGSPLADSAATWRDTLQETGAALEKFPGATRAESWELALAQFAESTRFGEKPAGALELNGWLELLWEDAPHLVVAGLNDGLVPEAVAGDAFLPEALRVRLGLKTNAQRFARDAYLLDALAAARAGGGRLDVLVGKTSAAGDPLRPSRLLLRCTDQELPERVAFLFRKTEATGASLPWTRAWRLRPPAKKPPEKISVTALRAWLACPFRFYLRHVLRLERVEPDKAELDALDFGTLVHGALQAMGEDEVLRDCKDEAVLRAALLATLERSTRAQFGGELTLPLVVQLESARQRLAAAARVQARERAAGWRIVQVEWPFERVLGGLVLRGKIDRIDRQVGTGAVRVLDYKTGDAALPPERAHLGPVDAAAAQPEWTRTLAGGTARRWLDLQLPLYRHAVTAEFGASAACGYFNLPKATGETAVVAWDGLTDDLQAAAMACAERTAAAIAAGDFWPPAEWTGRDAERDAFAELFHREAAASVEAEAFRGRMLAAGGQGAEGVAP
ncbi:MAG: PD-(D/E)XK nuclease family protein [Verrucomicrobiota bacterium]